MSLITEIEQLVIEHSQTNYWYEDEEIEGRFFSMIPTLLTALKAGQDMRDNYVEDLHQQYGIQAISLIYPEIAAWDAATGGKE